MRTRRRTRPTLAGVVLVAALALAACGSDSAEPETPELGDRPPPTEAETTTTTEAPTTTTLPVQVLDEIPEPGDWGDDWPGPDLPSGGLTGSIDPGEFNEFVLENAPAGVSPEEVVSTYLQLDPGDAGTQMLVAERGGPEAVDVTVIRTVEDGAVRAQRWAFALEERNRDFLAVADAETEAAAAGDAEAADEALDSNAGDAADEQELDAEEPDAVAWILTIEVTVQCQPGEGQQDFTTGSCG